MYIYIYNVQYFYIETEMQSNIKVLIRTKKLIDSTD